MLCNNAATIPFYNNLRNIEGNITKTAAIIPTSEGHIVSDTPSAAAPEDASTDNTNQQENSNSTSDSLIFIGDFNHVPLTMLPIGEIVYTL